MVISCGAARASIVPPGSIGKTFVAGYEATEASEITGMHDPINVRAAVVSDGTNKIALASVEVIGLLRDVVEMVKDRLEARGFKRRNVFVFCTHTHAAPDTMGLWGPRLGVSGVNRQYLYFLVDRIVACVVEAGASSVPVTLHHSRGSIKDNLVNFRREGGIDGTVDAVTFKDEEGRAVATLWTCTAQPEITTRVNTEMSADYPGIVSGLIEQSRGGIALFALGACGGQSPECAEQGFDRMASFAKKVFVAVENALAGEARVDGDSLEIREITGRIPVQNGNFLIMFKLGIFKRDVAEGAITASVSKWRIGNLHVVHLPGEPFPGLFERVVEPVEAAGGHVMVASLTNDAIGYIIPVGQFRLGRIDGSTKWLDPAKKEGFIGHEDESLGPEAGRIAKYALYELFTYKKVLAIGAHADDLTIWAGGTIKRLSAEGNEVTCVRVCDDWEDCVGVPRAEAMARNKEECEAAYKILGAADVLHLGYTSDYLAGLDGGEYIKLRERVVRLIRQRKPDVVISFDINGNDEENMDHVVVARAVNEACWQASFDALYPEHFAEGLGIHATAERYLFARNPSVTNFHVDVSDFIGEKVEAACKHVTVMKNFFHQYALLARANKLHVELLEDPKYDDWVRANLFIKLLYGEAGARHGVRYAEEFNRIDAGLLKGLARDES
ncbi:MAG: neutral/alkaline non-lysosomal ceramidase N-terminal domain-containing protein [Candidatus Lokiarchaeota archaeon]|nr:neutral/alkaline non-lysosomal ceramidase N-terminal domain-containing protein [Candidatus Lokiarchaeota archaeon]